jgi:CRP/FNR family transcriptional regulator
MRLDERLVRFFAERYKSTGRTVFEGSHQDIALQLNTSREVISRLLKNLENAGKIAAERNMVDYAALVKPD